MKRNAFVPILVALAAACTQDSGSSNPPVPVNDADLRAAIQSAGITIGGPPPPPPSQDPALVDLGGALFFDKILGGNRDMACATCHFPRPAAVLGDGMPLSIGTIGVGPAPARTLGAGREFEPRNSPSLLNVEFLGLGPNASMFWDRRVRKSGASLITPAGAVFPSDVTDVIAAQAMFPVTSRLEMRGETTDSNDVYGNPNELAQLGDTQFEEIWAGLMQRLLAIPAYVTKFNAAFPAIQTSDLHFKHAAMAIAAFQKQSFRAINTPFDNYVLGDNAALTEQEKRGAMLFFGTARCSTCHFGPLLGGFNNVANIGAPQLGPGTGAPVPLDAGFSQFAFRVPPLRNVELTAPYFHDGAYATLEAAVRHYNDVVFAQQNFDVSQLPPALQSRVHNAPNDIATVSATLDPRLTPMVGTITGSVVDDLVAFLKSLTDPAARNLSSLVPASVPSGLPVDD